ncbi:putative Glycosyl transferase, group 2 [Bradyrhizobium sp. ORS 278]|uniref:glycosyltransferase n=1 Tax=Bradyrhizobium sp. (strain ORS 278) TaxID=114615 RepID=UPI00015083FE|nr:glycosyltransferase [Bradyrhizobium sp. ORS 278]CAL80618.1 putative Glycosyl transferase, group 2 [Bradyrhizobium sp. ORS 278]
MTEERSYQDYALISESGLFDRGFYLRSNPDVAEAAVDPLQHFCEHGWREFRDPAPFFSLRYYSASASRRETIEGNPFVHYIRKGLHEGARTRPELMGPVEPIPTIRRAMWESVTGKIDPAEVDIIIPVYRGLRDTAACIYSVLTTEVATRFRLVVVNDKTPEPPLQRLLNKLAGRKLFHYIENEQNLGFTQSVNKGMQAGKNSHKLLLNSDTIVYAGWLDRIVAHASSGKIGTITPLSNNATIFSYPETNANNNYSIEVPLAALDAIISVVGRGAPVDVPTGVGYCMFIHRDCYHEVGELDVATFNRGYGEENDYCVRAKAAGWRNVAATDVFVRHTGEVSFALDASTQQKSGYLALLKKHPCYEGDVRKFVSRDLLSSVRRKIDVARLLLTVVKRRLAVFVSHNNGGGIETHLRQLAEQLEGVGYGVFIVSPSKTDPCAVSVNSFTSPLHVPNLGNLSVQEFIGLVLPRLLSAGLELFHVHSLVGFDLEHAKSLLDGVKSAGVRIVSTVHDYSAICPRNQLVDDGEDYCGLPGPLTCQECLKSYSYPGRRTGAAVAKYRYDYHQVLSLADVTFVPSEDTRARLQPFLPDVRLQVRSHLEPSRLLPRTPPTRSELSWDGTINVAVIGAIGPHKGSSVIFSCAADAAQRSLPIRFHVIGYTNIDERLRSVGVSITGPYFSDDDLRRRLIEVSPRFGFFPSIWPETYLYTLSDAFEIGLFPIAFDIGAQAERIADAQYGALIPVEERFNAQFINDTFLRLNDELGPDEWIPQTGAFASADDVCLYYRYKDDVPAEREKSRSDVMRPTPLSIAG